MLITLITWKSWLFSLCFFICALLDIARYFTHSVRLRSATPFCSHTGSVMWRPRGDIGEQRRRGDGYDTELNCPIRALHFKESLCRGGKYDLLFFSHPNEVSCPRSKKIRGLLHIANLASWIILQIDSLVKTYITFVVLTNVFTKYKIHPPPSISLWRFPKIMRRFQAWRDNATTRVIGQFPAGGFRKQQVPANKQQSFQLQSAV